MSRTQSRNPLAVAVGAALTATLAAAPVAQAEAANPFGLSDLSSGYMLASMAAFNPEDDAKAKEGKCGEGKCGEGKKDKEGKCGEGKCGEGEKGKEGKCGEGKCGEGKKDKEGKCGEGKKADKDKEGSCGGAA